MKKIKLKREGKKKKIVKKKNLNNRI